LGNQSALDSCQWSAITDWILDLDNGCKNVIP
jgi:hypothetical protein